MQKLFRSLVFVAAAVGVASSVAAGELTVKIAGGRATVIAKNVPLREILAEWARVGETKIVNGEKLAGGPISLELVDMPEKDVLDILLRSAAGYMTGPRPVGAPGASLYDRVMILATSRPPATNAFNPSPAPFGGRTVINQMPPQPPPEEDDDDGEPGDQGPMPPPGMMYPGQQFPGGPNGPQTMPVPGQMPAQNPNMMPPGAMPPGAMPPGAMPPGAMPPGAMPPGAMPPGAAPPGAAPPGVPPATSPRPGMLPAQPGPTNPYSPFARPPGANGRGGGPGDPDDR